MTKEEYFEKGKYIWQNFVPKSGQAEFVQGELLRAIEKLRDEAHRNGNGNFHQDCHGKLIQYLRTHLSDQQLFSNETIRQINEDLHRLSVENPPYLEDDIFDRIDERIVDWYVHKGDRIKHIPDPNLYC